MKLSTFHRTAETYYKAGVCVYLRSGPGMGKTETITNVVPQIAKAIGKRLGFVKIEGPLLTPADAVGYLVPHKTDDGRVESRYTDPFWWRTVEGKRLEDYDGGVIFVDEADKADVDVKKVLGEMALSGRCGPHRLPPGWVVWMAGNRAGDRSGSTKELDHLINRRMEIDVTADLAGWEAWALRDGVHHTIVAFGVQNPNIVFPDGPPEKQGPFCTPRSLVNLGRVLQVMSGGASELPTDDDAVESAAGMIGQAAASHLFATIRLDAELPKIESILKDPTGAKLPGAPDAQMLTCYKLAALAEDDTVAPFVKYVERLPADFAVTFAKAMVTRRPAFAAKKAMLEWCQRNSGIMATIASLK